MKKMFTTFSALLLTGAMFGATVPAADYTELSNAITNAVDGDIIELTGTVYNNADLTTDLTITKKITIKAQAGLASRPEIAGFGFKLSNGSALTIEGVKAYYDAPGSTKFTDSKYFLQAVTEVATIDHIKIIDCHISNYGRGLLRADNATNVATIGEVLVDNCVITNMSAVSAGYAVFAVKTAKIATATLRNSTFHHCISNVWYSEVTASAINFTMENVTIYKCGAVNAVVTKSDDTQSTTSAKNLINFSANEGSNYLISNCAIWGAYNDDYAASTTLTAIKIGATTGNVKLLNSIVNVNSTNLNATFTEDTRISTLTFFGLNNDLKITASASLTNVGDPRGYPMTVANAMSINPTQPGEAAFTYQNGTITLKEISHVTLLNLAGKEVGQYPHTQSIDATSLKPGIYLVQVTANGSTHTQKIVVR